MAKKRFTDDLFGLFEEPLSQNTPAKQPTEAPPTAPAIETESVEVEVPSPTPRARRKLSSKKFTADLDAFLSDSFSREGSSAHVPNPAPASAPKSRRRRKTGLDLLIQSTVTDEDRSLRGEKAPDTKRVTLIFNKQHLAELKEQAKDRGVYLKDVVQEMVSEYLQKQ
ncbi:MAG: hypothetical protein AAF597_14255 [Bacteroidota bacterium]